MATRRLAWSCAIRASSQLSSRTPFFTQPAIPKHHVTLGHRWSSNSAAPGSRIWSFEEIQALIKLDDSHKPKVTIIDVREPGEVASTGKIPGAINIPITTSPDSFHITDEDFEDRFGFERPGTEDELLFYCKAGVRGRAAATLARQAGWKKIGEYPGSWLDWAGEGGAVER